MLRLRVCGIFMGLGAVQTQIVHHIASVKRQTVAVYCHDKTVQILLPETTSVEDVAHHRHGDTDCWELELHASSSWRGWMILKEIVSKRDLVKTRARGVTSKIIIFLDLKKLTRKDESFTKHQLAAGVMWVHLLLKHPGGHTGFISFIYLFLVQLISREITFYEHGHVKSDKPLIWYAPIYHTCPTVAATRIPQYHQISPV